MALESLFVILLVGAVAGWLAGLIVKGYGYGLLGNIVIGIVGAFVAGLILPRLGLSVGSGIAGAIIHATVGAVILLFLIRLVKRA
ncbi:putative membrane protein [Roseovarius mucosus DSM 17069]|uniref:Putative membrane protein n=1 Tax=Roseovarius mucosus DSM 17069 TaxID=1288298 RepID=A0A0A0HID3_9RHOB|nr:GlsB/YeaQ/YmgE family stress response membrane protein [Roseovarius mucosus]KGM85918.1 putative membrane protein [Roseovarius mucosus DSM 17069]